MFNIGPAELAVIAVVALLVLGPKQLPELARGFGKLLRELRRHTDDVRNVVEREFYRLDHEGPLDASPRATPSVRGTGDAVPSVPSDEAPLLPAAGDPTRSQLDAGLRREEEPVTVYPRPESAPAPVPAPAREAPGVEASRTGPSDAPTPPTSPSSSTGAAPLASGEGGAPKDPRP